MCTSDEPCRFASMIERSRALPVATMGTIAAVSALHPLAKPSPSSNWSSIGVSLVVQLTLMSILSVIAMEAPPRTPIDNLIANTIDTPLSTAPPPLLVTPSALPNNSGGGSPLNLAAFAESDAPTGTAVQVATIEGVGLGMSPGTDSGFSEMIGETGNGGGGIGNGIGDGVGDGVGKGFFGIEIGSEKIVFVVDASRSMNYPYPGEAKNRLGRVKIELLNAVGRMTTDQRFFVIFFNTEPIPMPAPGLIAPNPSISRPLMEWVFKTKANGQTDPEAALLMALRLRPDRIYFLTDGDFSHRCVRAVREANHELIPIDTIGFGGREGEENLQEIASDSHGHYQFIPEPPQASPTTKTAANRP